MWERDDDEEESYLVVDFLKVIKRRMRTNDQENAICAIMVVGFHHLRGVGERREFTTLIQYCRE